MNQINKFFSVFCLEIFCFSLFPLWPANSLRQGNLDTENYFNKNLQSVFNYSNPDQVNFESLKLLEKSIELWENQNLDLFESNPEEFFKNKNFLYDRLEHSLEEKLSAWKKNNYFNSKEFDAYFKIKTDIQNADILNRNKNDLKEEILTGIVTSFNLYIDENLHSLENEFERIYQIELNKNSASEQSSDQVKALIEQVKNNAELQGQKILESIDLSNKDPNVDYVQLESGMTVNEFQKEYEKALKIWTDAEEKILTNRENWEQQVEENFTQQENIWIDAYNDLQTQKLNWCNQLQEKINSATEKLNEQLQKEIIESQTQLLTYNSILTENNNNLLDQFSDSFSIYESCRIMMEYAQEGFSFWYDSYKDDLANLSKKFHECRVDNDYNDEDYLVLVRKYNSGSNWLLNYKIQATENSDLDKLISDAEYTKSVCEYFNNLEENYQIDFDEVVEWLNIYKTNQDQMNNQISEIKKLCNQVIKDTGSYPEYEKKILELKDDQKLLEYNYSMNKAVYDFLNSEVSENSILGIQNLITELKNNYNVKNEEFESKSQQLTNLKKELEQLENKIESNLQEVLEYKIAFEEDKKNYDNLLKLKDAKNIDSIVINIQSLRDLVEDIDSLTETELSDMIKNYYALTKDLNSYDLFQSLGESTDNYDSYSNNINTSEKNNLKELQELITNFEEKDSNNLVDSSNLFTILSDIKIKSLSLDDATQEIVDLYINETMKRFYSRFIQTPNVEDDYNSISKIYSNLNQIKNFVEDPDCIADIFNSNFYSNLAEETKEKLIQFAASCTHLFLLDNIKSQEVRTQIENKYKEKESENNNLILEYQNIMCFVSGNEFYVDEDVQNFYRAQNFLSDYKLMQEKQNCNLENSNSLTLATFLEDSVLFSDFLESFDKDNFLEIIYNNFSFEEFYESFLSKMSDSTNDLCSALSNTVEEFVSQMNYDQLQSFENIFDNKEKFKNFFNEYSNEFAKEINLELDQEFSELIFNFNNQLVFDKDKINCDWYQYYLAGGKVLYSYLALNCDNEQISEIVKYINDSGVEQNEEIKKFIQYYKILTVRTEDDVKNLSEEELSLLFDYEYYQLNPMNELPGFDKTLNRDGIYYKFSSICKDAIEEELNLILPDYYNLKFQKQCNLIKQNRDYQKLEINGVGNVQSINQEKSYCDVYKKILLSFDGILYEDSTKLADIDLNDQKYSKLDEIYFAPDYQKRMELISSIKTELIYFNNAEYDEYRLNQQISAAAKEMAQSQKLYADKNNYVQNMQSTLATKQKEYDSQYKKLSELQNELNLISDQIHIQENVLNYANDVFYNSNENKEEKIAQVKSKLQEAEQLQKSISDQITEYQTYVSLLNAGVNKLDMPQSLEDYLTALEDSFYLNVLGTEINAGYLKAINDLERHNSQSQNFKNQLFTKNDSELNEQIFEWLNKINNLEDNNLLSKIILASWYDKKDDHKNLFNSNLSDLTGKYKQYNFTEEYQNNCNYLFDEIYKEITENYKEDYDKYLEYKDSINLDYLDAIKSAENYLLCEGAKKVAKYFEDSIEERKESALKMINHLFVLPTAAIFIPFIASQDTSIKSEKNYLELINSCASQLEELSLTSPTNLSYYFATIDTNERLTNYYQNRVNEFKDENSTDDLTFNNFIYAVNFELKNTSAIKQYEFVDYEIANKKLKEVFNKLSDQEKYSVTNILESFISKSSENLQTVYNLMNEQISNYSADDNFSSEILLTKIIKKQLELLALNKINYLGVTENYQIENFEQLVSSVSNLLQVNSSNKLEVFQNQLSSNLAKTKSVYQSQIESLNSMLENCTNYWNSAIYNFEQKKSEWENSFVNEYSKQVKKWDQSLLDYYSQKEEWITCNYSNLIDPKNQYNFDLTDFDTMKNFCNVKNMLQDYSSQISSSSFLDYVLNSSNQIVQSIQSQPGINKLIDVSLFAKQNKNLYSKQMVLELQSQMETVSNKLNESYAKSMLLELCNSFEEEILQYNECYKNYYEEMLRKDGYTIDSTIHRNVLVDSSLNTDKMEYQTVEKYKYFTYDFDEKNKLILEASNNINTYAYAQAYLAKIRNEIFGDGGLFYEHIGESGTFVDEIDTNKSLEENLIDPGKGQEGIIINQYVFNSQKAKYGYTENGKAFYDKKMWIPTNDFFTPPTIRELAEIGTSLFVQGYSINTGFKLFGLAKDIFFDLYEGITGNKTWENVIFDIGKNSLEEILNLALGDVFETYKKSLTNLIGNRATTFVEKTTKSFVNTTLSAINYDQDKQGVTFNSSVYKNFLVNTAAGGISNLTSYCLSYVDLKTNMGIDLAKTIFDVDKIQSVNELTGQMMGDAFSFAVNGSIDLNILGLYGAEGFDLGLLELHLGTDGISTKIGMGGSSYNIAKIGELTNNLGKTIEVLKKKYGDFDDKQLLEIVNLLGYGKETNVNLGNAIWDGDINLQFMTEQEMKDYLSKYGKQDKKALGFNVGKDIFISKDFNNFDTLEDLIKTTTVTAHEGSHAFGNLIEANAHLEGIETYFTLSNRFNKVIDQAYYQMMKREIIKDSNLKENTGEVNFWTLLVDANGGNKLVADGKNELTVVEIGNKIDENGKWVAASVEDVTDENLNELQIAIQTVGQTTFTQADVDLNKDGIITKDEKGTFTSQSTLKDEYIEQYSEYGALTKILSLDRTEQLLGSSAFDFNTYDKEVVMEVLGVDSDSYDRMKENGSFFDSLSTVQDLYNLAGLQLAKNKEKNGEEVSFKISDKKYQGYAFGENADGFYKFSVVNGDLYRDENSYNCVKMYKRSEEEKQKLMEEFNNSGNNTLSQKELTKIEWDIREDRNKRAQDVIVYTIDGINYDYHDEWIVDKYQTVDNMAYSNTRPDEDRNQPIEYGDHYVQGNTIVTDVNLSFGIDDKDYKSSSFIGTVLNVNNGTTLAGKFIDKHSLDDDSDLMYRGHGSNVLVKEKEGVYIAKKYDPSSDGCFVTTQENQQLLIKKLASWNLPANTQIRIHLKNEVCPTDVKERLKMQKSPID